MPVLIFSNTSIAKIAIAVPHSEVDLEISRRKASPEQTTSDLAYVGVQQIIEAEGVGKDEIGGLLFCSTTPDYRSPATACVLQGRLQLSKDCLAFDLNLGGAGLSYGLQTACALLQNINKPYLLLVVGDTTSKQLSKENGLQFGDAASVLLLKKTDAGSNEICISTGSDSTHYDNFIIKGGGFRGTNGLTNYIKDELQIREEAFIKEGTELTTSKVLQFLSDSNKSLDSYDAILIPPLGSQYQSAVMDRLSSLGSANIISTAHLGNTRGVSALLSLNEVFKSADESVQSPDILAIDIGEGMSWGIIGFSLDKDCMLPVIETGYKFEDGKIAREI